MLGWDTFGRVLASSPPPDVLVVASGKVIDTAAPQTLEAAYAVLRQGLGLVIRRAERHDPSLAALAAAFTRDLPGAVQLQLFVTPAGTHSFGWHYDFEEVFIVQVVGVKDYFFRDNTVDRATPRGGQPDFGRFRAEVSPVGTVRLLPGDWLYLPARWWHVAKCVEEALSVSIGVFPDESLGAGTGEFTR
jgi:ribosomal protein L16 Arg81 hydroxylase